MDADTMQGFAREWVMHQLHAIPDAPLRRYLEGLVHSDLRDWPAPALPPTPPSAALAPCAAAAPQGSRASTAAIVGPGVEPAPALTPETREQRARDILLSAFDEGRPLSRQLESDVQEILELTGGGALRQWCLRVREQWQRRQCEPGDRKTDQEPDFQTNRRFAHRTVHEIVAEERHEAGIASLAAAIAAGADDAAADSAACELTTRS
jgi:hypothetical protein